MTKFSNIDFSQLAHFNALAASWWNQDGAMKMLHAINPLRGEYIVQQCGSLFGKNVLDAGCGEGILSVSVAMEDASQKVIKTTNRHANCKILPVIYLHEAAELHAVPRPNYYDIITCMELLEHVPNPMSVILTCSKMLTHDGWLFCSTINRNFKSWLLAIIGAEEILKLIPLGSHKFDYFIRPNELCKWLDASSLIPHHVVGLRYNPLRCCFGLNNDLPITYMLTARHML